MEESAFAGTAVLIFLSAYFVPVGVLSFFYF